LNKTHWLRLSVIVILLTLLTVSAEAPYRNAYPEEARAIQEVIYRSHWDVGKAGFYLDPSYLADAFINDPRGGEISQLNLSVIRCVRNDKTITIKDVGWLDSFQATIEWRKQVAAKLDAIHQKMVMERREEMTQEEKFSLVICGQVPTGIYSVDPKTIDPRLFILDFISIHIFSGDVAKAVVTLSEGEKTMEEILVKIGDRWYIAGERFGLPYQTSGTVKYPVIQPTSNMPSAYPFNNYGPQPTSDSSDNVVTPQPYPQPYP
jgi:hypothetical protein